MPQSYPHIFALTLSDWHYPWWQDRQHLLSRLNARGWPVLYSTGPLSVWERGSREWKEASWRSTLERIRFGGAQPLLVDHPGRLPPLWPRQPVWDAMVYRRHARRLLTLAGNPGPDSRIAFICYPTYLPYVQNLRANWVVLHVFDAWNTNSSWSPSDARNLERLVERADLITCIAETMARTLPGDGAKRARIVPHGVDARAIMAGQNRPCPEDLAAIPRPRIGYLGRVSRKIDLELVAEIARRRRDWHWVIVGIVGVGFGKDAAAWEALEECRQAPNVHFLGRKGHGELPAYLAHMDVNTMCYRLSGTGYWTAVFPLKLFEYLSAGKPVVASDVENLRPYADVLAIAKTPDEWIGAIGDALQNGGRGTREQRQALALENTWDIRANMLEGWLLEMLRSPARKNGANSSETNTPSYTAVS